VIEQGKLDNVCLIDGDSLLYYEMGRESFEEACKGLDERLSDILAKCNTNRYVAFLTEGRCFRYNVDFLYKAKRKRKGDRPIIFPSLVEYLKKEWGFTSVEGLEADDLVSYYSNALTTFNIATPIICSPDKDVLYQCVGTHYNYRTAQFIETTEEEATSFLWKQVLMGDSTDNIPGLPGVGEKTADNWLKGRTKDFEVFALKQYIDKFGSTEGVRKFYQSFSLVKLLKDDSDITWFFRINLLPKAPEILERRFEKLVSDDIPSQVNLWDE
jgi:5'-3' exonuclease